MAITYTWKIIEMERNTADGGVVVAHWDCTGVDENGIAGRVYGAASFTPDATDPNFVAFEDLTEEDVLAWVHAAEDKEAKEEAIANEIAAKVNPVVSKGMPWTA